MNKNTEFSRRGFLKTVGFAGVAMAIEPTLNKVQAATSIMKGRKQTAKTQNCLIAYLAQEIRH